MDAQTRQIKRASDIKSMRVHDDSISVIITACQAFAMVATNLIRGWPR